MNLNLICDSSLIRYHRIAYKLLVKHQSTRSFIRLGKIVLELDNRNMY